MKQSTWNKWFEFSILIGILVFIIGTLDGSIAIKSYPYLAVSVLVNILICALYGVNKYED